MSLFKTRYEKLVKHITEHDITHTERTITLKRNTVKIFFIKQLTNTTALMDNVIKPLVMFGAEGDERLTGNNLENIIFADDIKTDSDDDKVLDYILDGMTIVLMSGERSYLVVNLKKVEHREVPEPKVTYTMRGPKDSFVENIDINISLIRYRLKDPNLKIERLVVGKRSKTAVALIYISDIVNEKVVREIRRRINAISTDVIWGTGELESLIQNSNWNLFSQTGAVERSDSACESIVEGKVVILADGGAIALIAPFTFSETMIACDDRYDNKFFGFFSRIIRYLALFLMLCSSAIYLALISYRTDILPADFIITIAKMRQSVIFPAIFDILILEFIIELVREAMIRVPEKIGPTIGIVGTIVIGQAAIAAGIFSPLLLIIVATSFMASFAAPNYFAAHPYRVLKFFLIITTGILGVYGLILGLTIIMINLVSINSFGVPFMAPYGPYNTYDATRALFFNRSFSPRRMQYLNTTDDTRSDDKKPSFKKRFLRLFKKN